MVELEVVLLACNYTAKKSCTQGVVIFHVPWKHHVYIIIMLKHMLLYRVESESEPILVEQVVGESLVVAGFDIRGVDPETEIVNEGKPRFMH